MLYPPGVEERIETDQDLYKEIEKLKDRIKELERQVTRLHETAKHGTSTRRDR